MAGIRSTAKFSQQSAGVVCALLLATRALAAPDLEAVWILYKAEKFATPELTEMGERLRDGYDFRTADPALRCIPASWTRVYSNPNTPLEIHQEEGAITIQYELFDIVRTIPLIEPNATLPPRQASANFAELGSSLAWYDGNALVVHTDKYGDDTRVLTTIRQWAGLHQSSLMSTVERYVREGDTLHVEITHFDPLIYSQPLVVTYTLDRETEYRVEHYGCDPQDAAINAL